MKKLGIVLIVLAAIIGIGFFMFMGTRNRLVGLEENVNEKWAQVQNVYQRRADLIPNLVNTVKGAAIMETQALTQVIEARAKATQVTPQVTPEALDKITENPDQFQKFQQAQDNLGQALSRLLVTVERYPDIKFNQNFVNLQTQLEGTENRVTVERMRYNEAAKEYNVAIRQFPANITAAIFDFNRKQFFEARAGADTAPQVNFP